MRPQNAPRARPQQMHGVVGVNVAPGQQAPGSGPGGDARAQAMGVNVQRLRVGVLVLCSLMAATAVAFSGIIGFVGLVGPHIARMLVGEDQRYFIPASAAAGAVMLSVSHAVSMLIIPGVAVPIGIITALVGVPFFITLIVTKRRNLW